MTVRYMSGVVKPKKELYSLISPDTVLVEHARVTFQVRSQTRIGGENCVRLDKDSTSGLSSGNQSS